MKYLSFLALVIILTPTFVFAEYKPLVGIPGVTNVNTDFNSYINALYALSISIAALLAVIKIVIAGVKWMTTDIITSKGEAKKDIQGALLGLLVVLAAVLIITVINPDILKGGLNISKSAPVSKVNGSGPVVLTATPKTNSEYGYLDLSKEDSKQTSAYRKECLDDGGKFVAVGKQARCYTNVPSGNNVSVLYNTCNKVSADKTCAPSDINETPAKTVCDNLKGKLVPDPDPYIETGKVNAGASICYYPN